MATSGPSSPDSSLVEPIMRSRTTGTSSWLASIGRIPSSPAPSLVAPTTTT
ncbi:hypothetical protein LINPERPRIM_LOCUS13171 [Linum perenne]